MSESELQLAIKQANWKQVTKELYSMRNRVCAGLCKIYKSKELSGDCFDEAVVICYENLCKPDFKLTVKLETYLSAVARILYLQELRRLNRIDNVKIEENSGNQEWELEEAFQLAKTSFLHLGQKCKEILVLFYYKKLSFEKIAIMLDLSNANVAKTQKHRCLSKAREVYQSMNIKN